jgi:hypothetical protein
LAGKEDGREGKDSFRLVMYFQHMLTSFNNNNNNNNNNSEGTVSTQSLSTVCPLGSVPVRSHLWGMEGLLE